MVFYMSHKTKLEQYLAYENLSSVQLAQRSGLSQSTVSRALKQMQVKKIGKGRSTRFALLQNPDPLSLFKVNQIGEIVSIGKLYQLTENRNLIEYTGSFLEFDGLPFFLYDLIPSGFLGGILLKHLQQFDPQLTISSKDWTDEEIFYFFENYGVDLSGNLLLSQKIALKVSAEQSCVIDESNYDQIAKEILHTSTGHSSVAGEQPKFACFDGKKHLIVKYSPLLSSDNSVAERIRDLLICEHLALKILSENGVLAASSEMVFSKRAYLKVERFDRVGEFGRKGLVSLRSLVMEYVGKQGNWVEVAKCLLAQKIITVSDLAHIEVLYAFGLMIGNTDMHNGNLSFYFEGYAVTGLAPAYDMLPMTFMPKQGEIIDLDYSIPRFIPVSIQNMDKAKQLSKQFWQSVHKHKVISENFKSQVACQFI